MAGKSDYLENAVLNTLRNVSLAVANVYVALFTTLPGEDATGGVEVSGGSYAREAVTFNAPAAGNMGSAADVVFPQATASRGTIVGFGLYDASSGGNLLYFNNLTASKLIDSGDQLKFPAGSVQVSES
jgi:hypothetical protein